MSSTAVGRRRGLPKQISSEDQALNMIAREAEARLAAKRAARAEARSIRMKELEKKQKEADEQMDKEYEREHDDPLKRRVVNSRIKSTASSSLNSSESSIDEIGLHNDEYVKQLKDNVKELEDKFRKAMVNSAQLDNERQAYQYQVECLKDLIEDMTENLDNLKDELMHKTKDFNKLTRDHEKLNDEFEKCMKLLADRERILDENGINLDGTLRDEPDGGTVTTTTISESNEPSQNHIEYSQFNNAEKEALEAEIQLLKDEIADLRNKNEGDLSRREAEHIRTEGAELERSFVDVSDEANAIQDDIRHRGLFINNNEKCDDFEVIDDGSQQGGIKNFEDKSFEKSDRTSLMSSVQTGMSESLESDLPLEISVDANHSGKQNEYDIVNAAEDIDKDALGTALNIDSLTSNNERPHSPMPSSNLNIDKYFLSDDNEPNDEDLHTATTFSINQYFASEDSVNESNTESTEVLEHEDHHFENIDTSVLESLKENRGAESPYLEVDAQITQKDDSKIETLDDGFHSVSLDDIDSRKNGVEHVDISNVTTESSTTDDKFQDVGVGTEKSLNEVPSDHTVILEASVTEESPYVPNTERDISNLSEVGSQTLDTELNQAFNSDHSISMGSEIESSVEYEFNIKKPDSLKEDNVVKEAPNEPIAVDRSDSNEISVSEKQDGAIDSNNQTIDKKDETKHLDISENETETSNAPEDGEGVRKDVEDLYDMIAKDTGTTAAQELNDSTDNIAQEPHDSTNDIVQAKELPPDATFGMFAVSTHVPSTQNNESQDPVFGLVSRASGESIKDNIQPESPAKKKKEGWLVRVESFNAPKANAPRIQQVQARSKSEAEIDTENHVSPPQTPETPNIPYIDEPETTEPVPKERKKKKKSKKKKGNAKIKDTDENEKTVEAQPGGSSAPTLSAPELLGYASESPAASPSPSPIVEKRSSKSSNSEIPQQFLDVQFNVAGDSDMSDVEKENDSSHSENSKTKPSGPNKRGSKKENCKTQ